MKVLILDIENTITRRADGTMDNSPFHPDNRLVSVGYKEACIHDDVSYPVFYHKELTLSPDGLQTQHNLLQSKLDTTTLLVGHNIKYDLKWLKSCGFIYEGKVWDTMVFEYVFLRGLKHGLSLQTCLERRGVEVAKSDTLATYFKQGSNVDTIPIKELIEYGKQDVLVTEQLYLAQLKHLDSMSSEDVTHYMKAVTLMNDFLPVLVDMELAGVALDIELLNNLDAEYTQELETIERLLSIETQRLMGDRPFNFNSTDHMSQLLYSKVVKDKKTWKQIFNIGSEERNSVKKQKKLKMFQPQEFKNIVHHNTEPVYKTTARKCKTCDGTGKVHRLTKSGGTYKKPSTCKVCNGTGVEQRLTQEVAGLKLPPLNRNVSAAGFSASNEDILFYVGLPSVPEEAKSFLTMLAKHNKLYTWKNTFIAQLLKFQHNTILHANYNQCITATGRLSCSEPNLQNQPTRDPVFKIKKAFISRFKSGCITDADFGQLEFRIAAYLSQCSMAIKAVQDGLDIHSLTRDFYHGKLQLQPKVLQPTMTRQEAKAETFGPLYGKTTEWTDQFYLLFPGIKKWHESIMKEVVTTKELRSPSGRVYAFPTAEWFINKNGERIATGHTQIKNYTVQGFATGDVVLLVLIDIHNYLKQHKAKSKLILQVHDSVATDTHPDELDLVQDAYKFAFDNVYNHAEQRWGIDINVPLAFDLVRGINWSDTKPIGEYSK